MTSPLNQPPSVELVERMRAYLERHPEGGALHVILDGNIGALAVMFCESFAWRQGDAEGVWLARQILALSKSQRVKLMRGRYNMRS